MACLLLTSVANHQRMCLTPVQRWQPVTAGQGAEVKLYRLIQCWLVGADHDERVATGIAHLLTHLTPV